MSSLEDFPVSPSAASMDKDTAVRGGNRRSLWLLIAESEVAKPSLSPSSRSFSSSPPTSLSSSYEKDFLAAWEGHTSLFPSSSPLSSSSYSGAFEDLDSSSAEKGENSRGKRERVRRGSVRSTVCGNCLSLSHMTIDCPSLLASEDCPSPVVSVVDDQQEEGEEREGGVMPLPSSLSSLSLKEEESTARKSVDSSVFYEEGEDEERSDKRHLTLEILRYYGEDPWKSKEDCPTAFSPTIPVLSSSGVSLSPLSLSPTWTGKKHPQLLTLESVPEEEDELSRHP